MVAEPLVYLVVWQIVAGTTAAKVDGFTPGASPPTTSRWSSCGTLFKIGSPANWEYRVREGSMSGFLLRPIHPVHVNRAFWV